MPTSKQPQPVVLADPLHNHTEHVLGMLFDQMPMGVVIFDRQFCLVRYNPTWAGHLFRYTHVTEAELIPGLSFFDLIPDAREQLLPIFERVLTGERFHQDGIELVADGIRSWWNLALEPIPNGETGPCGILGVSTDMTDQVLAEVELRRTQQRTEQQVTERTHELMSIIAVQQALASHLQANEVLQLIADESRRLTHTDLSALFLPDDEGLALAVMSSAYPVDIQPGYRMSKTDSVTGRAFVTGEVQRVADTRTAAVRFDPAATQQAHVKSILSIPLMSDGQAVGVLSVGNREGKPLGEEEERLLTLFVPSAVIALRNVRLYEQARETAAAAERGRLARDLHDAVTQTLFSASLTAEVLPRIWQRDPNEGMKRLEKLRELTRGALAEMRTLLLELRPTALTETPLYDLLRQLAEGIAGRTRIHIEVQVNNRCALPADMQIALYRIAQEALNNVAKHSNASQASVVLSFEPRQIQLQVRDNGCGFDPATTSTRQLGLRIMSERAEAIRASLRVDTAIGAGTTVTVVCEEPHPSAASPVRAVR